MLAIITYFINPDLMAWASDPPALCSPLDWNRPGTLRRLLLVWTFRTLGRNLTDTVVTRKEHTLVTNGPTAGYGIPFTFRDSWPYCSFSLAAANWFVFASGGLAMLLLAIRSRKEEENLIARFGDDYRRYKE